MAARRRKESAPADLERGERLARERLRRDAQRPAGELLEEALRLSRLAVELRSAGRRARR